MQLARSREKGEVEYRNNKYLEGLAFLIVVHDETHLALSILLPVFEVFLQFHYVTFYNACGISPEILVMGSKVIERYAEQCGLSYRQALLRQSS